MGAKFRGDATRGPAAMSLARRLFAGGDIFLRERVYFTGIAKIRASTQFTYETALKTAVKLGKKITSKIDFANAV